MNSSFGTSSGPSALLRFNCFVAIFTSSVIGFPGPVCLCFNYLFLLVECGCLLFVHILFLCCWILLYLFRLSIYLSFLFRCVVGLLFLCAIRLVCFFSCVLY